MKRRLARFAFALALALAGAAVAAPARAQNYQTYIGPLRELWAEGSANFQSGNFERAADRFDRAYQIDRSPVTGLWAARSFERAGKLLEALERYRELIDQNPLADGTATAWEVRRLAELERQQLLPAVPGILVEVTGAEPELVILTINARSIPSNLLGVRRPMNPGHVVIDASAPGAQAHAELELARGETKSITLDLAPNHGAVTVAPAGAKAQRADDARLKWESVRRKVGYVGIGVGGAAVLTGALFGFLALHDQSQLESLCPNRACDESLRARVDTYEAEKKFSTIGLLAGAALGVAGVGLYLSAPSESKQKSTHTAVFWLGDALFVRGEF